MELLNENKYDDFINLIKNDCLENINEYPSIMENLILIMIQLDDIDEKLDKQNISLVKRIDAYNYLFNENIYNGIYQKIINLDKNYDLSKDEYYKYYLFGIICCELYKIQLYSVNLNDNNSNEIVRSAIKETFDEMKNKSTKIINNAYNKTKTYYFSDFENLNNINNIFNDYGYVAY
jgi:hypothetical protein